MENYKLCFKTKFLFLVKHKYRSHVWQDTNVLWSQPYHSYNNSISCAFLETLSFHSCSNGISFSFYETQACGLWLLWVWIVHEIFACLSFWWGTVSCDIYVYEWKLLPQQFWNSVMIYHYHVLCKQYKCLQVGYLRDPKTFLSKSDTCFHDGVCKQLLFKLKLDDVRTRNRCFGCWTLCSSHYVRYPTHTISNCCP